MMRGLLIISGLTLLLPLLVYAQTTQDKVVPVALGIQAIDEQSGVAHPLTPGQHYYVVARDRAQRRVKLTNAPSLGTGESLQHRTVYWADSSALLPWNTNEGLLLKPGLKDSACDEQREPLRGYPGDYRASDLSHRVQVEKSAPQFFVESLPVTCRLPSETPMRLLETTRLDNGKRYDRVIVPVFLGGLGFERTQKKSAHVDLVFIVDTTRSAGQLMDRARKMVMTILGEVRAIAEDAHLEVRAGLIAFQGDPKEGKYEYVVKMWQLGPPTNVYRYIRNLNVGGREEGIDADLPAAAFDGVDAALRSMKWSLAATHFAILMPNSHSTDETVGDPEGQLSYPGQTAKLLQRLAGHENGAGVFIFTMQLGRYQGQAIIQKLMAKNYAGLSRSTGGWFWASTGDATDPFRKQFLDATGLVVAVRTEGNPSDIDDIKQRFMKLSANSETGFVIFEKERASNVGRAQIDRLYQLAKSTGSDLLFTSIWIERSEKTLERAVFLTERSMRELLSALDAFTENATAARLNDVLLRTCEVVVGNPVSRDDVVVGELLRCIAGHGVAKTWERAAKHMAPAKVMFKGLKQRLETWSRNIVVRKNFANIGGAWFRRSDLDASQ